MRCEDVPLEALLVREGLDDQVVAASDHLVDCPSCRERVRVMVCLRALAGQGVRTSKGWARPRWLAAAAVVLALALPAALLIPEGAPPASGIVPAGVPYPRFPLSIRSRPDDRRERRRAFQTYQAGDFELAADQLAKLPPDPEVSFFLGVSLYLADRPEQALPALDQAQKSPRWRRPAMWYRAHALMTLGESAKARAALRELADGPGEFQSEARALLDNPALPTQPRTPR